MHGVRRLQSQVVVAGGGPVGMLVAAELAAYGVDTVVFETGSGVSERPKATTLHARAVQSLARRGHLPPAPAATAGSAGSAGARTSSASAGAPGSGPGTTSVTAAPYDRDRPGSPFHFAGLPGLVITAPESEPEPILKCPQAELERLFEARARAAGARILRGHRVTRVVQEPGGIRVTAEGPGGRTDCTARYLVGADGARSTVREQAGIASDSYPATVSALTAAVTLPDPDALADGWHRTPRGWIVAKRDAQGLTHIRTLDCARAHRDRRSAPTLDEVRREVARIAGREIAMEGPRWLGRFSDFARLARTFRAGRVFLAGDAAHVHFPIGGQGLSTGVLDALNLGWKLALTVRGEAGPDLLDTYDPERRPVARRVVDNTRAQLALMRPGSELDALREVFAGLLAGDRDHGRLSGMISAQDTVLPEGAGRPSTGAGTFLRNVALTTQAGETDVIRLLQDGRPLLLLFGEPGSRYAAQARDWAGVVRVERVRPAAGVPYDALLVRPDGYVAWTPGGEDLPAALSAYFARAVRPPAPDPTAAPQPDSAEPCAAAAGPEPATPGAAAAGPCAAAAGPPAAMPDAAAAGPATPGAAVPGAAIPGPACPPAPGAATAGTAAQDAAVPGPVLSGVGVSGGGWVGAVSAQAGAAAPSAS